MQIIEGSKMELEIDNSMQKVFDLVNAQAAQDEQANTEKPEPVVVEQAEEVSESTDTQTTQEPETNSKQDFNKAIAEARALKNQEKAAKEAALAELEQLRLENEALKKSSNVDSSDYEFTSDDEIEALAEDMPTVSDKIRKAESLIKSQSETIKRHGQAKLDEINQKLQEIENAKIEQAFSDNPKLVHIKDNMPELWAYAVESDELIRGLPNYAGASYEKRFSDVLALVELKHGPIALPETNKTDPNGRKEATKKVIERDVPVSLTDVNGTAKPVTTPTLATANKGQVRQMFKNKTSDEIMAELRNY